MNVKYVMDYLRTKIQQAETRYNTTDNPDMKKFWEKRRAYLIDNLQRLQLKEHDRGEDRENKSD